MSRELLSKMSGLADKVFPALDALDKAGTTLQETSNAIKRAFVAGRIEAGKPWIQLSEVKEEKN